ncbi:hypothetical protein [Cohnella sp. AR92]|uniref:hypothetical protein n=1 Tax=Cohnella sp. AR92 TaxID=648716 RepID=UPI000F8D3F1A|nr:hypothetical protein [Cohnella sp. AR92]RUS45746.1 hypothetical protein ELR57_17960 [Cohnella sp. AR92]
MSYSFVIEPLLFFEFDSEDEQIEKCKEWGLLSGKASRIKSFYYKGNGMNESVSVIGFVDKMTAVIEFENKKRHCIHPSFLKEMQASNYGQKNASRAEGEADAGTDTDDAVSSAEQAIEQAIVDISEPPEEALVPVQAAAPKASKPSAEEDKPKAKKGKAKLELPEEKVKMVATVQEFTTVPNHFSDNDDEVVIYEQVRILEPELELGAAWSSHSNTLKKLELAIGDTISFEAKVAAKKLTKHPVPYKINNPSKIQKSE